MKHWDYNKGNAEYTLKRDVLGRILAIEVYEKESIVGENCDGHFFCSIPNAELVEALRELADKIEGKAND